MKKQLRLVLFAVLAIIMVVMMGLVASATTPEPADTDYYQVVDATGAHVGYYATLDAALDGVTADNYKVIVLKDATEAKGVTLDVAFTYTITGGTEGKTITFADTMTSTSGSNSVFMDLRAGSVKLENLTLDYTAATVKTAAKYFFILSVANTSMTLDSVEVKGETSAATFLFYGKTALTLTGTTSIGANAPVTFDVSGKQSSGSSLTISGGTYTAKESLFSAMTTTSIVISNATITGGTKSVFCFAHSKSNNSTLTLNGGAVVTATAAGVFEAKYKSTITINEGAVITASNAAIFKDFSTTNAATVTLNGGELHVVGENGKLASSDTMFVAGNITMTAGSLCVDGVEQIPTALDTYFDWTNIDVILASVEGAYIIDKEGNYAMTGEDCQFYRDAKAYLEANSGIDTTRFPKGRVNISGWIPIVVNHKDAMLAISGEYKLSGSAFLVQVKAGTVGIVNGSFEGADVPPIVVEGGTLVIIDGTFTAKSGNELITHTGGLVYIQGGNFTAGTAANDVLIKSTATFTEAETEVIGIEGGSFTVNTVVSLAGTARMAILGGTFRCAKVVDVTTATEVVVSGGNFAPLGETANYFVLNHADATLSIAGGTYLNAKTAIHAIAGTLTVTGGKYDIVQSGQGVLVDGTVTVTIGSNAEGPRFDPEFNLLAADTGDKSMAAVFLNASASAATVTISSGKFGNLSNMKGNVYAVWSNAAITNFNITGGYFYGGEGNGAIVLMAGALNISGDATVYGYRCVLMWGTSTVNISGGTFNPRVGQVNNVLVEVNGSAPNSVLNISGGTFNNFMHAVSVKSASTVTISGGTYTARTTNDSSQTEAFVLITAAATVTLAPNENGAAYDPVINLGTSSGKATLYSCGIKVTGTGAKVTVNAGTFNTKYVQNEILAASAAGSFAELKIGGGTFNLVGAGATLVPAVLDVADKVTVTGGHVIMGEGAILPMYANIATKGLKLTVNGTFGGMLSIREPLTKEVAGEGGAPTLQNVPYTLASVADQLALIIAYFGEENVTLADGVAEAQSWLPVVLNHADAELLLDNATVTVNKDFVVRVMAGKLTITGGTFTVAGDGTRLVVTDDGVAPENITITGIALVFSNRAEYRVDVNLAESTVVLSGYNELVFDKEGTYTIGSYEDISKYVKAALGETLPANLTVSINTWVPIVLNHVDAILNLTGGSYTTDSDYFLKLIAGTFNMTGGTLSVSTDKTGILIDGNATVNIGSDGADEALVPVIHLLDANATAIQKGAIVLTNKASSAVLTITNGKFGNVSNINGDKNFFALYQAGGATVNISGGDFYGGASATAIDVFGGTLNISGGNIYGYRNIRINQKATLNISGGTFNARPGQANNVLIHVEDAATDTTLNVSGGAFNDFMQCFTLDTTTKLTVTGGIFNASATASGNKYWIYAGGASDVVIAQHEGEDRTLDPVVTLKQAAFTLLHTAKAEAKVKISAGTFDVAEGVVGAKMISAAVKPTAFEVTGGTFTVLGAGNSLIADVLNAEGFKLENATVTVGGGAQIPTYSKLDTSTLRVTVLDTFLFTITKADSFTVSSVADIYTVLKAHFAEGNVTLVAEQTSGWIPLHLNNASATLTLNNVTDEYNGAYFVRVTAGTLNVTGGSFAAQADERIFEILGDATVAINGGTYTSNGATAYVLYLGSGVDTENISMNDVSLTLGSSGNAPFLMDITVTMNKLVVNGFSEYVIDEECNIEIDSPADIVDGIKALLESYFSEGFTEKCTVELTTWVPLHINHEKAVVTISAGTFTCDSAFMFKVTKGTLNITGGTFNAPAGDFIHLTGAGKINIAPATDSTVEIRPLHRVIYANGATGSDVVIKGGSFVQTTPDLASEQKHTFFTYDNGAGSIKDATLTIEDGYFEATRMMLLYYAAVDATIEGGTFVSNFVVTTDGPVTKRSTTNNNEHMFSPRGEGAVLTINGGSFDNKQGKYILAMNGGGGAKTVINGGTFNGGSAWLFTNYATTLIVNDGTFTDTEGFLTDAGIYNNGAGSDFTVNGGSFTGSVPSAALIRAVKGVVTINGGTFQGSLFRVTANADVAVFGGEFTASGDKAWLFEFGADTNKYNFYVYTPTTFTVENGAYVIDTAADAVTTREMLKNATIAVNGNARVGFATAGTYTFATAADVKALIATFIPEGKITFNDLPLIDPETGLQKVDGDENPIFIPSTYAIKANGAITLVVTGGEWSFGGDCLFTLTGGADLVITGGTFNVTGGDIIYVAAAGSEITIGTDSSDNAPEFYVTMGGNVLHVEKVASITTINNGVFVKDVIDRTNYTGPLFYYGNVGSAVEKASLLTIKNGYFEATRVLMDYYGKVTTTIYGGVFKSNTVLDKLTDDDLTSKYDSAFAENPNVAIDPVNHIERSNAFLLNSRGADSSLNIYGGTFDGAFGYSIIASNGGDGAVFNLYGGTFTGGYYWLWTNRLVTINIGEHLAGYKQKVDEDGNLMWEDADKTIPVMEEIWVSPTFEAKDSFTDHGFQLVRSADIAATETGTIKVNISAGTFSMKDLYGRHMFNMQGPTDIVITGGTFTISMDSAVKDADRAVNTVMFRTDGSGSIRGTTNMDIYGGTFVAARVVYYRYAGGVLNVYGGTFRSNLKAKKVIDGSHMFAISHDEAIFNIYGGTFRGNEYSYSLLAMNVATSGTMKLNVLGGTFTGGNKWMYVNQPGTIVIDRNPLKNDPAYAAYNLTDPTFKELSEQVSSSVYGFYIHKNFAGGTFDVNYLKVNLPMDTQAASIFVTEGGNITFTKDVSIATPSRIFQITNAFRGHVLIQGGKYEVQNTGNMFYITTQTTSIGEGELMNSTLVIEDGTFTATESATTFCLYCEIPEYTFHIKGGKFTAEGARIFFLSGYENSLTGMATSVIIDGGSFTSTATRMFYLDHNSAPLIVNDGTFVFEDRTGLKDDNAIVYAVGKQASTILLRGGTFIDNRTGSAQSFIKMNNRATIRMEGDFKLYVKEQKEYFLKDANNPVNSMPIHETTSTMYKGETYYLCFGYYTENAPVMVGSPAIRPVLGAEGITFTSSVSSATAAYLATLGTVSYGTLIFPTDYIVGGWENGTNFLEVLKAYAADKGRSEAETFVMVEAKDGMTTAQDGTITIRASLINIKEANYTKRFTGIAYAKVTAADGTETYYWATHVSAAVTSTMRDVATYAMNDVNATPIPKEGRIYCYASIMKENYYSRYTTRLQDSLRKYLPAGQNKPKF